MPAIPELSRMPEIAFSQVREDPLTELQVIYRLATQQNHPLRVLLVASGGCTALSVLTHTAIAHVDAVDLNPAQIHLVELKRQAMLHLPMNEQVCLLGIERLNDPVPRCDPGDRLSLYQKLRPRLPKSTGIFWDDRPDQIRVGVNRVGRFESLFRELSSHFAAIGLDPMANPETALTSADWRSIFERVFERQKLAQIFGEAAVNYSMDRTFGEHFADMFAQALRQFVPHENYFITQVWRDRYPTRADNIPLYLQASTQPNIRTRCDRLQLHIGAFIPTLEKLAAIEPFDLIQFSNISDWMPLSELNAMLAIAVSSLKPGGALIGRRLNGDHHLASVMQNHLQVNHAWSQELQQCDRSFFYREIVVGFRSSL